MGLSFQHMDGASFPMNDVRLSQFMEVRNQQRKDAEIEQKQEQARRGDAVAAAVVGSHEYREERDLHKAARLFQAAADQGDDWGLNNLGSMLLNGVGGLEQDHKLAVECFNRSALLVNPWGMYNLAVCYLYGYGVAPNHTAAFEWLHASAKWDNPAAHVMLGVCVCV
jgi:TPR repeat protein